MVQGFVLGKSTLHGDWRHPAIQVFFLQVKETEAAVFLKGVLRFSMLNHTCTRDFFWSGLNILVWLELELGTPSPECQVGSPTPREIRIYYTDLNQ